MIKNDRPRDSFGLQLLKKMCRLNGNRLQSFPGQVELHLKSVPKKKLEHLERCKKDKIPGKNDENDGGMVKNDDVWSKWSNMIRHLDGLKSFTNLNLVYFGIVTIIS